MTVKTFLAATALAVGLGGAASAATLTISGGNPVGFGSTATYDSDCTTPVGPGAAATKCYNPSGPAGLLKEDLKTFESAAEWPGLFVSADARLTVTFLGKEAGATNTAFSMAGGSVTNNAAVLSSFSTIIKKGVVDFTFESSLNGTPMAGFKGFSGSAAIAFSQIFGGTSVYAFFDDSGASNDRDWDDMVVRLDVSPVPLPAGAVLLLTGLGGLAVARRLRKTA